MEETNIKEVAEEIKNASEEELKKVVEDWFSKTRTAGMKLGAQFISIAIYDVIKKHVVKKEKASLRDYKRAMDDIIKILMVQLKTVQNDSNVEETSNDE